MSYIPHTKADIFSMLKELNLTSVDELFKEIPNSLKVSKDKLDAIPEGLTELELSKLMQKKAKKDVAQLNFIGGGAYEHYIPAAVWDIVSRGEYLTSYTPYQAEASQGNLQLMYEYQSMMSSLMSMDSSNASLYDGASSLAEAILMAVRIKQKTNIRRVLIPANINPYYLETARTIVKTQNIEINTVKFNEKTGSIDLDDLEKLSNNPFTALVVQQPNFFGVVEDADFITNFAHSKDALVVGVVNPIASALLNPPGSWGESGADIACGEGQPLGVPLSSGGPYFGFMCTKKSNLRQLPGRIVGKTHDVNGKDGFVLTLQAREQHIRRSKATSNICTNQGLLVTAATIYMSLMGFDGLRNVALKSHQNKNLTVKKLRSLQGVDVIFSQNSFHELVLKLQKPAKEIISKLSAKGIQLGVALEEYYPQLNNCILCCVTETKTEEEINILVEELKKVL